MIVRHTTMGIIFIVSLIAAPNIFAENSTPDTSHQHQQLQLQSTHKDPQVPQQTTNNRILELERSFQKNIDKYDEMIRDLGKQSDKYKDLVEIHNQSANTGSFIASIMQIISILIAIISTVLIVVITHYTPQYFRTIRRMKQVEKKADAKQLLDILMARIELGVAQQELDKSSKRTEDDSDSTDDTKSVVAAYTKALQIRGTLEEIRSGGKNVDIETLCNVLQQLSYMDTEKSWTKDIREYLLLLLSSDFLDDDKANQAVKNLLRNL